ncbi:hypothetical protein PPACK8108_LOCUS20637 [Phakopsora pachyrhizi]|uniref:Uncharacterized protein n=2 Tax=Phakopsora pachyrhizi TaxID=170000 RepID=A0AAV0BI99_PHAPC|nr:hypothetical protein PPACK8108_LOCUS20637 [Phakopsora pachyrhizi]
MRIFCANFKRAIQYCTKKDQLNCNLPTEELPNLLEIFISVFESELFKLITDLEQQFSEFSEAVTELFDRLYSDKSQDSLLRNQSNEIVDFLQVISWIGSGCSRLNKRFKQPVNESMENQIVDFNQKAAKLLKPVDNAEELKSINKVIMTMYARMKRLAEKELIESQDEKITMTEGGASEFDNMENGFFESEL